MADANANPPRLRPEAPARQASFSARRKWLIGFNVAVATLALLAIVGMANYLASRYFTRIPLTARKQFSLSPQTLKVVRSITNEIKTTVFFDSRDPKDLRELITGLLKEYNYLNPKIIFKTVDPSRNPGEAELVLAAYKLTALKDRNFVIVDCAGRSKVFYENELADYGYEPVPGKPNEFDKQMAAFRGEMVFTTAIFNLANPREFKVCFLQGHGEHDPEKTTESHGYAKFADALKEKTNIRWEKISLYYTNDVPADCNLLIIAGPQARFEDQELVKIDNYLKQGGRLFVLLNNMVRGPRTGIERVLGEWGVGVADNVVFDPQFSPSDGRDLLTAQMDNQHPIVKALSEATEDLRIRLVLPRAVGPSTIAPSMPNAPELKFLAASSKNATESTDIRDGVVYPKPGAAHSTFGLIVAVEQGGVKGVSSERGTMRMVVVGDSLGMDNQLIDTFGNHSFAALAAGWLLDRPQILFEGLVPAPLKEYKLVMTRRQANAVQWILLAAMPGCILLFGGLVWLRRRR